MNIFWLDNNPVINATYHCDKHVLKMIVEYAQLLSTAHRVLDGTRLVLENPHTEKEHVLHLMPGEMVVWDDAGFQYTGPLYKATHINHPCAVWVRENSAHYYELYNLFICLLVEYKARYNKRHACSGLICALLNAPKSIAGADEVDYRPQAMPEQFKDDDVVAAYRRYYNGDKQWATWTNRPVPAWFTGV